MNQKLVTVLFVSVFCYGVTYSSPLNPQNDGMGLPEEKPPTDPRSTTQQINKKIEASSPSTIPPSNIPPLNQHTNASKTANVSSPTVKAVIDPGHTLNTTEPHQKVTEEALNENTNNKTKSTSSGKVSNETTAATSLPASSVIPAELPSTASTIAKSTTAGPAPPTNVINHNSTTNASANNTSTPEKASNATPTTTTTTTTTTTSTTTTIKPSTTTNSPVSANKDNVVEHNTPAPIQEKHFDGQSFIGGMALTIGLTAIGFIAFKYYKSGKIDMNYRTL